MYRSSLTLAVATTLLASSPNSYAASLAQLSVSRSIEIQAPPSKVWAVMGDYGDVGYLTAVERVEIIRGKNNRIGAQRRVTLKGGGTVLETLTARRRHQVLSYRMDNGVLPISDYAATLQIFSMKSGCRLVWSGQFRSRPTENVASTGADQTAIRFVTSVYDEGLAAIKAEAER